MEQRREQGYKYCLVPTCDNTTKNSPDKVFFLIPRYEDVRKRWCKIMRRRMISLSSSLYCCEDHFDLEEDTTNYIKYKIMALEGKHVRLHLKKGVIPHKLMCERKCSQTSQEMESSQNLEANTNSSHLHTEDIELKTETEDIELKTETEDIELKTETEDIELKMETEDSTSLSDVCYKYMHDKSIQVNIKNNYRSKGTNVNLRAKTKDAAVSTFISTKTTSTSPLKMVRTGTKRRLFQENYAEIGSVSSATKVTCKSKDMPTQPSTSKYANRAAEAKSCLIKAKQHLVSSRNIKNEIKTEVTAALERLYQLVKEADSDKGKKKGKWLKDKKKKKQRNN